MAVKPAWTVSIPTLFSHCVCVCSSVFMRACFLADAQKSGAPLSIWEFGLKSRMWFLEQPQTSHSQRGDWRSLANWYSFSSSTTEAPAEEIGCSFFFFSFSSPLSSSSPIWPNLSVADKNKSEESQLQTRCPLAGVCSVLPSDDVFPLSFALWSAHPVFFPSFSPLFSSLTDYKIW